MEKVAIKVGIIGCGWIIEKAHLPALQLNNYVKVTGIYDLKLERALEVASKFHIPYVYDSFESLLESDIDAVIISTPNSTHADYSIRSLEAGKHVLCEKPVGLNINEMERVIEIAKESNKVYMPAHVNRFRPDIRQIFDIISKGGIGSVKSIEAGWIRRDGVPRPGTWFTSKKLSGGGVLIDLGSHILDIALMLMKNVDIEMMESYKWNEENNFKAASWFGQSDGNMLQDVEENVISKIQFEEEKKIFIALSWSSSIPNDCTYFLIKGTKGEMKLKTLFGFSDHKLWNEGSLMIKDEDNIEKVIKEEGEFAKKAFSKMIDYFIQQIKTGKSDYFLTPEDGFRVVEMIEKIYESENQNPELRSYVNRWQRIE